MNDVLTRICNDKRAEIGRRKALRPVAALREAAGRAGPPRGFAARIREAAAAGRLALIAEIKKASPSRGLIRDEFDPPALATAYASAGATCLSVLTDTPYFQGEDRHLVAAREAVPLPVLRKDFTLDPYQVIEARALGADCILLIMAALADGQAAELEAAATELGMDVLVEVHDAAELDRALALRSPLIGVNNRNLKTLAVDLETTVRLARLLPADRMLICESGLGAHADLVRMRQHGAVGFLVGESLMRQPDVAAATRALLGHSEVATGAMP